MDLFELIKTRRSIREFADKPIAKEVLENIVDAARFAPTARNVQPWEFVVVVDKNNLKKVAAATEHGKFIAGCGACIIIFSQDTKYFLEDCSAATQNVLLAVRALGIGSCWVAGDKKAYAKDINALLGVPDNFKLVSLVGLGYPLNDKVFREPPEKRSVKEITHWEKF